MKMYDGVLQRVRQVEEKNGIRYATTEGALYKTLSVFLIIALIYTMGINLICVLSGSLRLYSLNHGSVATIEGKDYTEVEYWEYKGLDAEKMEDNIVSDSLDIMLSAGISSVLILAGFILNRCRLYITGGVLAAAPSVYLLLYFKAKLTDANGVVGLSPKYYWRHLIPLAIIILAIVFMTVIAVRAKYKLRKQYNKVTENLFNMYNVKLSEDGVITDEQWDEFLKVYDPRADYNKQFAENTANEE